MMSKLRGSQPWALILCNASDQTAPNWPPLDYFNKLITSRDGNGLYTWWQEVSGRNIDLAGSKVFGWYRLSKSLAEIPSMDRATLVATAQAAARAAGADLSGYRHTIAVVTGFKDSGNVGADVACGITGTNGQPGWRWCSRCQGLAFWDGSRDPGPCPAGGRHDHGDSSYYSIPHDTSFPNGQSGWRWCKKCETLIFNTATPAPCSDGGTHALGSSYDYLLRKDSTGENEQQNWRWCKKCQALAYSDGSRPPGACAAGGTHDHTGSGNYSIPYAWAANLGFLAHETGHAFGLGHAFGPSRQGDVCNDRSPGAYGDWTDIMSWANTASFAAPLFTPAGAGLSAPTLYKLGWLSGPDVKTIILPASAMNYKLRPLYGGTAGSTPRLVRIVEPTQGWIYTIEYRVPQSWDQGLKTARVVIHAMRTLYQEGQDGWRYCSHCEGLIYAGQTACPAGGVHDGSASSDYSIALNAGSAAGQTKWRWCKKCCGLFFAGNATPGACPAGGTHDGSLSHDYALPSGGAGQSNWRWCKKCQGLAFAGNNTPGVCPAGGLHDHGSSANYVLSTGLFTNGQNKWRWCNKCQGLYYAGLGACKGGDVHKFTGDDYALVQNLAGAAGQAGWRYCSKCYGMAFNDGSRPVGVCPAGGTHDHSTSGNYVIPLDVEVEVGQQQWYVCIKCHALNYIDSHRGSGSCSDGKNHERWPDKGYIVAHNTEAVVGRDGFRWCRKCENMVLGDNPAGCKVGGEHDTSSSGNYVVRTDPASLVREQAFWRTCTQCNTLFALNCGTGEKTCAEGGKHSPADVEYFLTQKTNDTFWRWCSKCMSMAFWDGSRDSGPCPAGGRHDHSRSGYYILPRFGNDVIQVVNDNLVAGESWSDPGNRVRIKVLAMDVSSATVRI